MSIAVYARGQLVRLSNNFQDADSADVDPTTVSLEVMPPDSGSPDTYTYAGSQISRTDAGDYYIDIEASQEGTWYYRWVSTGTGQGAVEGQFEVAPSPF